MTPNTILPVYFLKKIVGIAVVFAALVLSGCVSSGSSVSGYGGPSISSVSAKKETATKEVRKTKRELRKARRDLKALEQRASRDERRLKRKRISKKYKARVEERVKKRKPLIRKAKRTLRSAERAHKRAERDERRAIRAVRTAKRRKAEAERRQAAAKKREDERQKKLARAQLERKDGEKKRGFGSRLFALNDPALANVRDYEARVDGSFPVAGIPVEQMNKRFLRQEVNYRTRHKVGTLVVDPHSKFLYLVQPRGRAMRYGIGVGKAGFEWSGSAHVGWKQEWPKWTPPAEMIERRPELEKWSAENGGMPGGPTNPLGARALYLMQGNVDTLYRLHGTPQWKSIGTAASSGCIRLMNQDIIDLYKRVPNGTKVVVL